MSIVKKYEEFEKLLLKDDADSISRLFDEILKETFDIINQKIENNKTLDVNNPEESAAIRAMFEYMIELWDEGNLDEAKEVGYDMAYLVDDKKLKEMFSMFVLGMLDGLKVDEFFNKYVNQNNVYKDYFFTDFKDEIDELIIKHKKKFQEEFSKDAK
jgi:hypothetical protein